MSSLKTTQPAIEFTFPGFGAVMLTTNLCFFPALSPDDRPVYERERGFKKRMVRHDLMVIYLYLHEADHI